jgi:bacterioferritin-associated ferredoxin
MIVCCCHAVSELEIEATIRRGATTLADIGRACGAGTDCGSCLSDLEDRLERACERSRAGLCPLPVLKAANGDTATPAPAPASAA